MKDLSYLDYVSDERHMTAYGEYQRRYASTIRESDRVLIAGARARVRRRGGERRALVQPSCHLVAPLA